MIFGSSMVQMEENNQESGVVDNSIEISNLVGLNQRNNQDSDVEMEDEEVEEVPKHLNTLNSSGGFLVVSPDKLSVQYTNVNMHGHDVGAIQANCPAPTRRLVYYFEMYVVDAGTKGQMSLGFTSENCMMTRQPGWDPNTYGYHGDDGMLYRGQGKGEIFGPTYTSGDTVGGGINYASQEIFFTKNGKLVGKVHKDVKSPLFPTVAVHSQNEKVNVNFEQKPFVFDIKGFASEERLKQQKSIEKISLPPDVSHGIVRSYLIHYGYQDTLNSFDMESKRTLPPIPAAQVNGFSEQGDMYALDHRKIMRQLIRHGDIGAAFGKLREWYPQIVQNDTSSICFLLHCQQFIELVQSRKLEEAVQYARAELASFFGIQSMYPVLEDCIALLAYEEPSKSPVSYLLKTSQREVTADAVNTMILLTNPELKDSEKCMQSHLEKLLRQLTACCLEKRALNGGQGESFQLRRVLQNLKDGTW